MLSQILRPRIVVHIKTFNTILPVLRLNCRLIQLRFKLNQRLPRQMLLCVNTLLHQHVNQGDLVRLQDGGLVILRSQNKPESNLHHKPLMVAIPDESNDIQMLDNTEMPFLLAPIDEQEYQNMLNSIDYRMIHSTAPSQIHDIALTEESIPSLPIMTASSWMGSHHLSQCCLMRGSNPEPTLVTRRRDIKRFSALLPSP